MNKRGFSETWYTVLKLVIGVLFLLVLLGIFASLRSMLLEKHECVNPLQILAEEAEAQCLRVNEDPLTVIVPVDLNQNCHIETATHKLCVYSKDTRIDCVATEHCSYPWGPQSVFGRTGLTRVLLEIEKTDGESAVKLTDVSR